MNWNQPICDACWKAEEPDRQPVRLKAQRRELEKCCMCGGLANGGILVRRHPSECNFPKVAS